MKRHWKVKTNAKQILTYTCMYLATDNGDFINTFTQQNKAINATGSYASLQIAEFKMQTSNNALLRIFIVCQLLTK